MWPISFDSKVVYTHIHHKRGPYLTSCLFLFSNWKAGSYWTALIDQYTVNFHKLVFALAEAVGICWVYGFKRFSNDVRAMIGDKWVDHKSFWYLKLQLCFAVPVVMSVSLSCQHYVKNNSLETWVKISFGKLLHFNYFTVIYHTVKNSVKLQYLNWQLGL